ncbi:DUF2220 domain-containing protein [Treponema sp. OttesenSCG-928-L16]|nr:DUF2220 domain-containing protein [Treponema sp. OttesenSCG-928-L16]
MRQGRNYFGDLDEHGFLILSQFRRSFMHVRSFCMDEAALRRFDDFRGPGKTIPDETVKEKVLPFLTEEEGRVFSRLQEDPSRNRLEQERITQAYIARRLEEIC